MKSKVIILAFCLSIIVPSISYAHPPSEIKITYDSATKMLTAVIYHNVSNSASHDIKRVDVGLNGKEIVSHLISRQDNNLTQSVTYLIPDAKSGDTLSVKAYCSISGELERKIKVE